LSYIAAARTCYALGPDQSHNLKGKVEAMVQTVVTAQELYAKAALVDLERLDTLQGQCKLVEAEELFRSAFWEDVRPSVRAWRRVQGLAEDPLQALRESGYVELISRERAAKDAATQQRTRRRASISRRQQANLGAGVLVLEDRETHAFLAF
jgi:L-rhamnose isomerase / sugar isomerase